MFLEKLALGKGLGVDRGLGESGEDRMGVAAGPGTPSCCLFLYRGPQKEVRLKIMLCWGPDASFVNNIISGSPEQDGDRDMAWVDGSL